MSGISLKIIQPIRKEKDLARKSYFAAEDEGDGGDQDFIHTNLFVLIDKERRIRGFYDGTEFEDIEKLKADMVILKNEYE